MRFEWGESSFAKIGKMGRSKGLLCSGEFHRGRAFIKHPTHVTPPKTLLGIVRIERVFVRVGVVQAVQANPMNYSSLTRKRSAKS